MNSLSVSTHHAMNTWWQVRISHEDHRYAVQAAQSAFQITDHLETQFSKFRPDSEISALAAIPAGSPFRLSESVFACLMLAKEINRKTHGAFDVGFSGCGSNDWHLNNETQSFIAGVAGCQLDLGAIGKGFALDRMAEELRNWSCHQFFIMSSGSSLLAGDPPESGMGWGVRVGQDGSAREVAIARQAIGTSGFSMQQNHIFDPVTGRTSTRHQRTWAVSPTAAEADAFSTAWMNMEWTEIVSLCSEHPTISAGIIDSQGGFSHTGPFWESMRT